MPELPEVENLRLGLEKTILGQRIKYIEINKPKLVSGKGTIRISSLKKKREFITGLTKERFITVERRAKNLIFKLSKGKIILAHLKMSGQFVYQAFRSAKPVIGGHPIELSEHKLPNKHTHIIFKLERGTLYYNDTRMFGYLLYYPNIKTFEESNHFEYLGLEPLSRKFTAQYLFHTFKEKKGKIKAVLMNQRIVAGLGNIYVDESLFEARIRPNRSTNSISYIETTRLHKAIIRIMKRAIRMGGSSVATYRLLDETQGNYAREHQVYGQGGKPCPKCKNPLQKITIRNRTTIFCPHCQK